MSFSPGQVKDTFDDIDVLSTVPGNVQGRTTSTTTTILTHDHSHKHDRELGHDPDRPSTSCNRTTATHVAQRAVPEIA
jgi:hypothetical protein